MEPSIAEEPSIANCYRIRNKRSGLYLGVASSSRKTSARLEHRELKSVGNALRNSQLWFVFSVSGSRYMAINMRSRLVMNVSRNRMHAGARLEQVRLQREDPTAMHLWLLTPEDGYFILRNTISKLYLTTAFSVSQDVACVQQWNLQRTSPDRDSQLWAFEIEETFEPFPMVCLYKLEDMFAIANLTINFTNFSYPDSRQFTIGQIFIPFPLINDATATSPIKCPYYVLRRYSCWGMVGSRIHRKNFPAPPPSNWSTTVGLISGNEEKVRKITGFSIKLDGSFRMSTFLLDVLGDDIARQLHVEVGPDNDEPCRKSLPIYFRHEPAPGIAVSIWLRKDRYVLYKINRTKVLEWTIRDFSENFIQNSIEIPRDTTGDTTG